MVAMVTSRNSTSNSDGARAVISNRIHPRREGEIAAAIGKEEKGREKRKKKKKKKEERKKKSRATVGFFFNHCARCGHV